MYHEYYHLSEIIDRKNLGWLKIGVTLVVDNGKE